MESGAFLKEMIERNYKEVEFRIKQNTSDYVGECEAVNMVRQLHETQSNIIDLYKYSLSTLDINDLHNYNYMMSQVTEADVRNLKRGTTSGRYYNGIF